MERLVYLDNSATTKPCDAAVENINRALCQNWGNPSSLHILGINAENEVNRTRLAAARLLKAKPQEIIFTSGGTESNNTAITGALLKNSGRGKRIVTTSVEHPSVIETVRRFEEYGFEAVYLKPDSTGKIPVEEIEKAVTPDTVLMSMMLVNNETGAVQPVKEAARILHEKSRFGLFHCDAVQAFGKLPAVPSQLGVDFLSVSAHKIHGPKGIGFLYKKENVHIKPLLNGGGQEHGMRSSTESVPLIAGFGGAIEELPDINLQLTRQKELRNYAVKRLTENGLSVINSAEDCLPYILNVSVTGYRSETLLHFLESRNVFVSSGSACSKGKGSYVLREMGFDSARADSALRISFSRYNTQEDIDILAAALKEAAQKLRRV